MVRGDSPRPSSRVEAVDVHGPLPGWGLEMPYSLGCQEDAGCASGASSPSGSPSLDIVMAARDQPLSKLLGTLLDALPLARIRTPTVWVYHKGRPRSRELADMVAAITERAQIRIALGLPNVGRAEHTCVHHVVQNYARLADLTIFLKDTALAHAHLGIATRLLAFAARLPAVDAWCARPPVAVNLSFALDSYVSETCWRFGRCYKNESWKLASARPFGAWLSHHGVTPIQNMPAGQVQACWGGFFAASRRALTASPQAIYEAIEAELSQADSLEEGHYMERSWPTLFGLKRPMRPQFVRVGIYTAACGAAASYNHTALLELPRAAGSFTSSSLLNMPPEYVDDGPDCDRAQACRSAVRAWRAGVASMLRFIFFTDRPQTLAQAERHGWTGVLLPGSACNVRDLKASPGSELNGFDYTAYIALTPDSISLAATLHIVTHHLASGPSVALVARRRGGLDTARSAERSFHTSHSTAELEAATNRTMLQASAVIRRASTAASSFSRTWRALAAANPHVREQFTLDVALQQAEQARAVTIVDLHAAKRLVYPVVPTPAVVTPPAAPSAAGSSSKGKGEHPRKKGTKVVK